MSLFFNIFHGADPSYPKEISYSLLSLEFATKAALLLTNGINFPRVSDFRAQGAKYSWQPGCSCVNSLLKDINVSSSHLYFLRAKHKIFQPCPPFINMSSSCNHYHWWNLIWKICKKSQNKQQCIVHARCPLFEGMINTLKYCPIKTYWCIFLKTVSMKIYSKCPVLLFLWL